MEAKKCPICGFDIVLERPGKKHERKRRNFIVANPNKKPIPAWTDKKLLELQKFVTEDCEDCWGVVGEDDCDDCEFLWVLKTLATVRALNTRIEGLEATLDVAAASYANLCGASAPSTDVIKGLWAAEVTYGMEKNET